MDALSELLRVIKVDSAIYFNAEFSHPWSLETPEARELAPVLSPMLAPGAHVIIFHLLTEGRAEAQVHDGERVTLTAGDIVVFPHGHRHVMSSGSGPSPIDVGWVYPAILARNLALIHGGGGGAAARFICGFMACDPLLSLAFLSGLPPLIRVNIRDDPSGQWLENSLRFSVAEASAPGAGASVVLTRLSEAMFAETLRRYIRTLPEVQTGWLAGAGDPKVGKALSLLHHRPAHPWTVGELAREAGLSRTVLAERFKLFLDESPMAYLTRWRLRLGARALGNRSQGVAEIAADVGYESEAAFSRAFKREYGLPPAAYRRNQAPRSA
jgi:AraC-like DNA-binding protein